MHGIIHRLGFIKRENYQFKGEGTISLKINDDGEKDSIPFLLHTN